MTPEAALELALECADRGVPAFPIAISYDDEKHATNKRPLSAHGHRDAEADRGTVRRLFQNAYRLQPGEEYGVGLWPGPANRVVLDVDDKGGLRGSDELDALEAEHGRLPDHPVVPTPSGGTHRWFAKPPGVHVGNADLAPGINVRADDGWVVAPGTITTWGAWEVEEATLVPAPLWPAWLATRLTGGANGQPNGQTRGRWQPLDRDALDPRDLDALAALEALGGHDPYLGGDGSVLVTRPGKAAGASASIGYLGPASSRSSATIGHGWRAGSTTSTSWPPSPPVETPGGSPAPRGWLRGSFPASSRRCCIRSGVAGCSCASSPPSAARLASARLGSPSR